MSIIFTELNFLKINLTKLYYIGNETHDKENSTAFSPSLRTIHRQIYNYMLNITLL